MSFIRVTVDEQNLHITDSPKIAAQGVNENYIVFDFDATWTGFSKVALFYREKDETHVYESLIVDNQAVVPHEVTDQEGKICFGVCGIKDDQVYTSEILTYKVVKGLYTAGQESEPPTPGIYEQMLELASQITDIVIGTSQLEDNAVTAEKLEDSAVRLRFINVRISPEMFEQDTMYIDYPYRAAVPLIGVTEFMRPEVCFSLAYAIKSIFAPVAESYAGGVYIYAKEIPNGTVTIPVIDMMR